MQYRGRMCARRAVVGAALKRQALPAFALSLWILAERTGGIKGLAGESPNARALKKDAVPATMPHCVHVARRGRIFRLLFFAGKVNSF